MAFPLVGTCQNKTRASHQSKTPKRSINTEVFCFWWKMFACLHPPLRLRMWLFTAFGLFLETFWLIPNPSARPPALHVSFTSVSGLAAQTHAQFFECLRWDRGCCRRPLQVATCDACNNSSVINRQRPAACSLERGLWLHVCSLPLFEMICP